MGEKDLTEKNLEDHPDIFSDIVNGCIFEGNRRVKPDELMETAVHSQYKADDNKLHEQERDIAKYWKKEEVNFILYGIENQTMIDRYIPFRIIGYDGASYRQQLLKDENSENDKDTPDNPSEDGMEQAKAKKIIAPVVTIVLYFGTEERRSTYV